MSQRNRGDSARAAAAADMNDASDAAASSSSAPPPFFDLKAMLAGQCGGNIGNRAFLEFLSRTTHCNDLLAHLLVDSVGCEYPQLKPLVQRLIVDFAKSAKDMYASHIPLTDVATSWLKRVGRAAAESAEGKKKMAEFERRLVTSVKRQQEILVLNQVLNKLQTSVATAHMASDTDWGEWIIHEKQALESDAGERGKLDSATKNALDKFRDDCWAVHHRGEGRQMDSEIAVHAPAGAAQLICPLSQSYYVHPMRNSECDHIFSRNSIVEVLQHAQNEALKKRVELDPNFSAKCPLCSKKLSLAMLFEDKELERRVAQHLRKEKDRQERGEMSESIAAAAAGNTNKRKRGGVKLEPQTGYDDLTQNVDAAGAADGQEEGAAAAASPSRSRSARR